MKTDPKFDSMKVINDYAGGHRHLITVGRILAALSAFMALVPFYDLWQIIKADETIPQVYKDEFEILNTKETLGKFLSEVYVFSLTRYKNPRILKAVVEDEKRTKIHPMVQQVIRDIAIRGKSDMFVPVLDLLYLCISDDTEEYERIGLRYPDRKAFIEATGDLRGTLDSEHALKYSRLLDTCYFHDLNEYRSFLYDSNIGT